MKRIFFCLAIVLLVFVCMFSSLACKEKEKNFDMLNNEIFLINPDGSVEFFGQAEYEITSNGLKFCLFPDDSYSVDISSVVGIEITIPQKYKNKEVKRIFNNNPLYNITIDKIIIPKSIVKISKYVSFTNIEEITFQGTTSQWNALVEELDSCSINCIPKEITCSNGKVSSVVCSNIHLHQENNGEGNQGYPDDPFNPNPFQPGE